MNVLIREWTEKDLPKIMAVERACFSDPWTTEMLKGEFAKTGFCGVLVEADGEIVGYACATAVFEDADLPKIAVLKEYRGKGLGGKLIDGLFERAAALGVTRIFLEVRVSNENALALYYNRGFEKTRIRKRYYANGEDALEMVKSL